MRIVMLCVPVFVLAACAGSRVPAMRGTTQPIAHFGSNPEFSEALKQVEAPNEAQRLLANGDKLFAAREYEQALDVYKQAATAAKAESNNQVLVEALSQVARMYSIATEFEEGRVWLTKAEAYADPDEPLGWSRFLGVQGRLFWQDEKDNEKAKATFIEMYEYCGEQNLYSRQLDAAHMVALVAPPEEQVQWALNAIQAAEKAGEKGWLAVLWNNLGWTYEEQGNYEKMLDALINARKFHHEVGNDHSKLVADFGVGRAYWRNGQLAEAREWLEAAFATAKQRHAEDPEDLEKGEWVGWGNIYLADILFDEGNPEEALKLFREGRPYIIKAGIENWWPEELKRLDDKYAKLEATDE
ncbi:MAG: tetratricopeptide repeat protein [Planctomycetes bacterium]|nr:tetratricopeptide repeat protein [Planctomycetota bacterium]